MTRGTKQECYRRFCDRCEYQNLGRCGKHLANPYIHTLSSCPLQLWGENREMYPRVEEQKPFRLLWITQDVAQGGITSFITYLSYYKPANLSITLLYFSDYKADHEKVEVMKKNGITVKCVLSMSQTELDSLMSQCDVLTMSYIWEKDWIEAVKSSISHTNFNKLFVAQAHGECEFSQQAANNQAYISTGLNRIATAPSSGSQAMLINAGFDPSSIHTLQYILPPENPSVLYRDIKLATDYIPYTNNPYRFLWLGRLDPVKQLPLSAKLVQQFRSNAIPPFLSKSRLTVVGDGWCKDQIMQELAQYDFIDYMPWADADTKLTLYRSHDMLLCHSMKEGGPLVVNEALYHGLPVHSFPVGMHEKLASLDPDQLIYTDKGSIADHVYRTSSLRSIAKRHSRIASFRDLFGVQNTLINFSILAGFQLKWA